MFTASRRSAVIVNEEMPMSNLVPMAGISDANSASSTWASTP